MLASQLPHQFALDRRRYSSFAITSFRARFSSNNSADICFNRRFSSSSSRNRRMSAASIAILCLPLVISRVADFVLPTNVSYRPSGFDCFQDRNDLMLTEFALSHLGLLASYSPGNLYFSMVRFLGRVTN